MDIIHLSPNQQASKIIAIGDDKNFSNNTRQFKLYKNGHTCCAYCGLKAEYAIRSRFSGEPLGKYTHNDLYGMRNGKYVMMTIDHILPRSYGGGNQLSNLRMLCYDCNQERGNHCTFEEAIDILENKELYIRRGQPYEQNFDKFVNKLHKKYSYSIMQTVSLDNFLVDIFRQ